MKCLVAVLIVALISTHGCHGGRSVPLSHARQYLGTQVLNGQCASGVQKIFYDYYGSWVLGRTSSWSQGVKVWGNSVPVGTAIASFKDGRYQGSRGLGHAAIYVGQNSAGIQVYDQWSGQVFHQRTLRINYGGRKPYSNHADYFYVVE